MSSFACTVCECTLFQPHAWVNGIVFAVVLSVTWCLLLLPLCFFFSCLLPLSHSRIRAPSRVDTCNDCFHTKEQHGVKSGDLTSPTTSKTRTTCTWLEYFFCLPLLSPSWCFVCTLHSHVRVVYMACLFLPHDFLLLLRRFLLLLLSPFFWCFLWSTIIRATVLKATPAKKPTAAKKITPAFSASNLRPTPKSEHAAASTSSGTPARVKHIRSAEVPPLLRKMSSAVLTFSKGKR
jgi:hypothetical protein